MNRFSVALCSLLIAALGCSRSRLESQVDAPATPPPAPASVPPLTRPLSQPAVPRLVAIGDLHGDLDATRRVLRLAGAIDERDAWIGAGLVIVQTGDEIDRGDQDREVLDLIEKLKAEAKSAGGAMLALSGNHEIMNVSRDFRYVTPHSFEEFMGENGRGAAFEPGGRYALMLAERPIFMRVGDTLFVHGGILPKHALYGLNRMHEELRSWIRGQLPFPPAIVMAADGPVWTRAYSDAPDAAACAALRETLRMLDSKRMVMGHTVQLGGIRSVCDGLGWLIDVGMSKFYGGPIQALELTGDAIKVLAE
jgi:hypothetical protein